MIVPAVTEVCLLQAAHSDAKGFPPCGHPCRRRTRDIETRVTSHAAQASSSGNWCWNSTSEAGKWGADLETNRMFIL